MISISFVALVFSAVLGGGSCLVVEVSATGLSGHGAMILPQAAPHRLIRALDRLPAWVDATPTVRSGRIIDLASAPAINIIPPRASARVALQFEEQAPRTAETIERLQAALAHGVQVSLTAASCPPPHPATVDPG